MILSKFEKGKKTSFEISDGYDFKKYSESESKIENVFSLSLTNDVDDEKLRLLVILSPIFIAAFDNGSYELEFLKKTIENSAYPYGLYPNFFENFDKIQYLKAYEDSNKQIVTEDIRLREDNTIDFYFNPIKDSYLKSLVVMVDSLIEDDKNRKTLLKFFAKMRNDIVINGRRSILANGIQAFYLNKYVVVWALELFDFIKENKTDTSKFLEPIYDLTNNLKTPRLA